MLHELQAEGQVLDEAALAALSPYLRQHIDRFGRYQLDLTRRPPTIDYDRFVLPSAGDAGGPSRLVQQPPLWPTA